jgi:site-specific recombinase XerD
MNRIYGNIGRNKVIHPDVLTKFVAGISDRRDKAIILLLIDAGLRAGEVVHLNRDSITLGSRKALDGAVELFGAGKVSQIGSKRDRVFQITDRTVAALNEYLNEDRWHDNSPALFITKKWVRLSSNHIGQVMCRWCDRIGIERISPRQLRQNFALAVVRGGGSPATLFQLLGLVDRRAFQSHSPTSGTLEDVAA